VSLSGDVLGRDSTVTELRPFFGLRRTGPRQNAQVLWTRDQRRTESDPFVPTEVTHDSLFAAYTLDAGAGTAHPRHLHPRPPRRTTWAPRTWPRTWRISPWCRISGALPRQLPRHLHAQDDAIVRTEAKTVAHRGALQYDDVFAAQRIWLHSEYVWRDATPRSPRRVWASWWSRSSRVAGLSARDATPLDGALTPLPSLVDDDTLTATGIDLGLPGPGDDTTPWSLVLDLGDVLGFDSLDVYVDRTIERPFT
jgi:hypothetical protein